MRLLTAVAILMTVMWAAEAQAELETTYDSHVFGDWDGDGYTDRFRQATTRDATTGEVDPPGTGAPGHPWSGIYYMDGWCQCEDELPIVWGTRTTLHGMREDTPMGGPRIDATIELWGTRFERVLMDSGDGYLVVDEEAYEPPVASFQLTHVSPSAWYDQYSYGGACGPGADPPSQCSDSGAGPNYGYGWKVLVTPADQVEVMQVSSMCVRARAHGESGAGQVLFCAPVDWQDPGEVSRRETHFDYDSTGTLEWRPMLWDGTPLPNAWCTLGHGDSLEWQADAYHKGGITTTTGWATTRIYGCSQ